MAISRALSLPAPVAVAAGGGRPRSVDGRAVEAVRDSWLVEDRWWTEAPVSRRYWELVTAGGRNELVFRDRIAGRWWRQR
ncbi:MAG TPA: hypothetical protein VL977_05420 [Solirubrobacteraceae bacterium]|nr:hypothetical protein [Solirubrobacteraceae bacterium]